MKHTGLAVKHTGLLTTLARSHRRHGEMVDASDLGSGELFIGVRVPLPVSRFEF